MTTLAKDEGLTVPREETWDVVVIGAGMAGLACARALVEDGLKVLVLEARERVGGRILSVRVKGQEAIELGAEFVHGRPTELLDLAAEAGCEVYERAGERVCLEGGRMEGRRGGRRSIRSSA